MLSLKHSFKVIVIAGLALLLALSLTGFSPTPQGIPPTHKDNKATREVVGYFTSWGVYGSGYRVKNIVTSGSADKLTVLNYAFGNVAPGSGNQVQCLLADPWADYQMTYTAEDSVDGQAVPWGEPLRGHFAQLAKLKALYPNIKVVISLGGWTLSKYFSDAALTPVSRQAFVASCIDLFIKGNLPADQDAGGPGSAAGLFDGIDIDWEYPAAEGNPGNIYRPEDTKNFTLLLQEFRTQLNKINPKLMLTVAAPAGSTQYKLIELRKIAKYLDFVNLMTYDFYGPWSTTTNHHANLMPSLFDPTPHKDRASVMRTVTDYLKGGVPANKLVVGVPFYGHGWTGVKNKNHGLYQPASGPAPFISSGEDGTENYNVLSTLTTQGYKRYFDPLALAPWLFNGTTFWTYEDSQSLCYKTAYVRTMQLHGMMFWDLSGDDASGTLITAIKTGLNRNGSGWGMGQCKNGK